MKKKVQITLKNGKLNFARIGLTKPMEKVLDINFDKTEIILEYKNKILTLAPYLEKKDDEREEIKNDTYIILKKVGNVIKDTKRNSFRFNIPSLIAKEWDLQNNKFVDLKIKDNKIEITQYKDEIDYTADNLKKLLPIFTVKVEKGGIGKTFFATTIATGLAAADFKVLLLTTDPQNNVLDMLLKSKEIKDKKYYITFDKNEVVINNKIQGLKYWLKNENGVILNLRENLDFIPLESPLDGNKKFQENIGELLYFLKNEKNYDCVVIDSVPTRKVDETVLNYTDKLIIPAYGDKLTLQGITTVIKELGASKVASIIFNRYENTVVEKKYYLELKEALKDTNIYYPEPIKRLSAITQLIEKSKCIWESEDKKIIEVQNIMKKLLEKLILESSLIEK